MSNIYIPTCNLNCTCMNSECMYKHYLRYKERKVVHKICNDNALSVITPNKEESNMTIRKSNCKYGFLCVNENCNYRHFLNPKGRYAVVDLYNKYQETSSVSSHTSSVSSISSSATVISRNTKLVIDLETKSPVKQSKNIYDALEDTDGFQEVINKKSVKEVKVPKPVDVKMKKFEVSFASMAKKSSEEYKQEQFDLMMASSSKDAWDDY